MSLNRVQKWLFFGPLLLGPIGMLLVATAVLPTRWNASLGGDYWLIGLGYGATLHHADCQILIFGDSSGMVGISPNQLSDDTGLTACNIAENEGLLVVNGTLVLDQYLSQNAPPKYLVITQSPDSFDPQGAGGHGVGEGVTYRMAQPGLWSKIVYSARNAPTFLAWVSTGLDSILRNLRGKHFTEEQLTVRNRTGGQLLLEDPPANSCAGPSEASKPNPSWVKHLRARYGKNGTRVLVDAMPVPDCEANLKAFRENLQGLIDNRVETLPLQDFYIGNRHLNAAGVKAATAMIAAQVNHYERPPVGGAH